MKLSCRKQSIIIDAGINYDSPTANIKKIIPTDTITIINA